MDYNISQLKSLLEKYKKSIDQLIIVCNKKDDTVAVENYNNTSIDTEFLSDEEFQQLYNMAYSQNIPFDIFTSEVDFIKNILSNYNKIKNKKIIVYNSAQNGTGAGRKSLIPSFCNLLGLTCTGSDAYRVSLCRDKFAINSILEANNICVPKTFLYNGLDSSIVKIPTGKYLIKPLYESASIGITDKNIFYTNSIPFDYINELSNSLKQPLIFQTFISGYELEIPILKRNEDILVFDPVILFFDKDELCMGDTILDYEKIYNDNYYFADLPNKLYHLNDNIKNIAKTVAELLCLNGLCRVDGRIASNGEFYITDVSTNPHFIKHSSVSYSFHKNNYTDSDIFKSILYLC